MRTAHLVPASARTIRILDVLAAFIAAAVLCAAAFGSLAAYPAVAGAVPVVAFAAALRLIRMAVAVPADHSGAALCRAAGFLGFGMLAVGGTTAVLPVAGPGVRPVVAVAGLVVALACYLLGLLHLPGVVGTRHALLRRLADGLSLGVSIVFSAWVILPSGGLPPLVLVTALLAASGLAIIGLSALHVAGRPPAALLWAAGAAAAVLGMSGLVLLIVYRAPQWAALVAAVPLVVGAVLASQGANRADLVARPVDPVRADANLSAYPLLTVPAVVATVAAAYRLVTVGEFDRTSIVLGLAVIPTLVVREILAVKEIRRYARRLISQEAHFRSLVSGANDLTLVVGEDLVVRWQSPAAARLFGLSDADVVGRPFPELMHPEDAADVTEVLTGVLAGRLPRDGRPPLVTARLADGYGAWRETESTVTDQRGVPEVGALVVHVRDVGDRRRLERTLHKLSFTDQLTGLANRRELMRAIATQRGVPGHTGAVLVIDLHGMAGVNDVHGREVGDAVLVEVGRRLTETAGSDDVVSRLGGDEFAVVTVDRPVLAYALGLRLLTTLTAPYQLPGATVELHVSIGLADLAGGDGVDDVLRRADLARRRARQLGRNRVEWYEADLEEQVTRRMELERELPGALARGELDLVYQPVIGLHDAQPVGVEALLRWRSPVLGTVLPSELLPVAEDIGLITELGGWVLDTALRQLAKWSGTSNGRGPLAAVRHSRPTGVGMTSGRGPVEPAAGQPGGGPEQPLWMAVNVSPVELADRNFAGRVRTALATHGIAPERLVVEVAEPRVAADVPAVVGQLAELRALGVRTALDDFGSGQEPLAQLRRMPVDFLKIDRSLVTDRSAWQGQSRPLIGVLASLGRRLGLEIIAEGLESVDQVDQARLAGCRFGQGNGLSRPAPAERVEAYLAEFGSPAS